MLLIPVQPHDGVHFVLELQLQFLQLLALPFLLARQILDAVVLADLDIELSMLLG